MKKQVLYSFIATGLFFCFTILNNHSSAQGGAPNAFNYQAVARNSSGVILANQSVKIRFTFHQNSGAGTIEYQETQSLTTNQFGLFTAAIGQGAVNQGSWAGINLAGADQYLQVEMDPTGGNSFIDMGTSQLLSVPYAMNSASSYWTLNSGNIYNANSGNVGIGTNLPSSKLSVSPAGGQSGMDISDPIDGFILFGSKSGLNEGLIINKTGSSTGTSAIYGSTAGYSGGGVEGTATAGGVGVWGHVADGSQGVYGQSATGSGVYGTSGAIGTNGYAYGGSMGITSYYGSSFKEVVGVYGNANDTSGAAAISYGVVGENMSPKAKYNVGVFGYATGSTGLNSRNWGVMGLSDDDSSALGVYGLGYGTVSSRALEGDAITGSAQIGVFAYAAGGTNPYAGYFSGTIYATTANAGIKSFMIDHPSDPANKYLYHSSVESNDMMNIYNGNVTTDANGLAVIGLPSYFEVLNKDFKYQLTCIGQFAQAIVKEEVQNNQFTIQTDKPNVKVSWMVTGVRHDPLADKYRIQNEVDKAPSERGKYLQPEIYGLTMSSAIHPPMLIERGENIHPIVNHTPPVAPKGKEDVKK